MTWATIYKHFLLLATSRVSFFLKNDVPAEFDKRRIVRKHTQKMEKDTWS